MINKIEAFEVNGKVFLSYKEAEEELNKSLPFEVSKKISDILKAVYQISQLDIINNENLFNISFNIKEKILMPEWFVTKIYHDIFIKLLKEYSIDYYAYDGDERSTAFFNIYLKNIKNIPEEDYVLDFVLTELEKLKTK